MTLQLSEIDYPPCWPDQHSLLVTASGCLLIGAKPGDFQVRLDEPRFLEAFDAWWESAPDAFKGVWMQADLAEAVDAFIATVPQREHMLDWVRHLELLAERLREAAR